MRLRWRRAALALARRLRMRAARSCAEPAPGKPSATGATLRASRTMKKAIPPKRMAPTMKIGSRMLPETAVELEEAEEVDVVGVVASSSPPLVRLESELEAPRPSLPVADPEAAPAAPAAATDPPAAPAALVCLARASWTALLSWALLIVGVAAAPADVSRAGVWPAKRVRSRVASSLL